MRKAFVRMKRLLQRWVLSLPLWLQGEKCLGKGNMKDVPKIGEKIRLWRDPRRFIITHLIPQPDGFVAVWVKSFPWLESNTALLEYASDYLTVVSRKQPQRTLDDLCLHLEQKQLCSDYTAEWIIHSLNSDGSLRNNEDTSIPVYRRRRSHLVPGWRASHSGL